MKKSTKKTDLIFTILLVLVLIIGLSLLIYPSFSNAWNQRHQTHAIEGYAEQIARLNNEDYEQLWQDAVDYNKTLPDKGAFWSMTE